MDLPALTGAPPWPAPPLAALRRVVERLESARIESVLGGSGLLAVLGLVDAIGDWDLTTDAPLEAVLAATRDLPHERVGPNGVHADHKLRLEGGAVELIVGHAMVTAGGIVALPSLSRGRWRGVLMGSPEVWATAYWLLGRPAKAETLLAWLEVHGSSAAALERLLSSPLPPVLRSTLERLRGRSGASPRSAGPE